VKRGVSGCTNVGRLGILRGVLEMTVIDCMATIDCRFKIMVLVRKSVREELLDSFKERSRK